MPHTKFAIVQIFHQSFYQLIYLNVLKKFKAEKKEEEKD